MQEEERTKSRISWTEDRVRRDDKGEEEEEAVWRGRIDPRTVRTPTQSLSGSHRYMLFFVKTKTFN